MAAVATTANLGAVDMQSKRKPIKWSNLLVGAGMNIFQVATLGQPMENVKTYVSANRNASLTEAAVSIWHRGPIKGFYQGLLPWVRGHPAYSSSSVA